jgi:cyclopropane-fatty-acyl-phospholipid synthase
MNKNQKAITELLQLVGIKINGSNPWDIHVHDNRFFKKVLSDSILGLGESYMEGWWACKRIDQLLERLIRAKMGDHIKANIRLLYLGLRTKVFNLQSFSKAFHVIDVHYDIGNELYQLMLDSQMVYTCGYWKGGATNLEDAQKEKMELICKKLELKEGMTVLDIGCGWGSFMKYASKNYGVKCTGLTISKEQKQLGEELCQGQPIDFIFQDYRLHEGLYDRVLSIGMFEAVGYKNYHDYMTMTHRCLKEDGIALLHTIGCNESKTRADPWVDKYIFPNGMVPSISQIGGAMENLFVIEDLHNFGEDYDKTLMAWHENFQKNWHQLSQGNPKKYTPKFKRMWEFYLLIFAGAFRARSSHVWQIVMTKIGSPQPQWCVNRSYQR